MNVGFSYRKYLFLFLKKKKKKEKKSEKKRRRKMKKKDDVYFNRVVGVEIHQKKRKKCG